MRSSCRDRAGAWPRQPRGLSLRRQPGLCTCAREARLRASRHNRAADELRTRDRGSGTPDATAAAGWSDRGERRGAGGLNCPPHLLRRLRYVRGARFIGADEVPVVLVPRVEARQEEAEPRASDLPEHAWLDPEIPKEPCPGSEPDDAVLTHELERACGPVDDEIASDVEHHLRLHLPALRSLPMARRVQ